MKIVFDSAFDGKSWPTVLDNRQAAVGEIRVGRLGLLGSLETMLGLRGQTIAEGVRIASLMPFVQKTEGFWSKSAEVDPFGVCRELIRLHDYLYLHGWQSQRVTPRLADLALLTGSILPGVPQKIQAILDALTDYNGPLTDLVLLESGEDLPLLWQQLFVKLTEKGVACEICEIKRTKAAGDLESAKNDVFSPANDGSIQLVRNAGVLEAAEDVAAWMATVAEKDGLDDTIIIGGDAVLDKALHRFGLPVTGAIPEHGSSLLQLLHLVLACGWSPPDPAPVMELLTMPASPIPPSISRLLIKALEKWPALASPLWQDNLAQGLAAIKEPEEQQRVAERLQIVFSSVAKDTYPVQEIDGRLDMLIKWLQGRFQGDEVANPVLGQCRVFKEMISASGQIDFSEPFLQKLLDEATSAVPSLPLLAAQAGLAAISTPEAITGPAKRVIWWNFGRNSVPSLALPILSAAEQKTLVELGVELPDSARITTNQAKRWRRPLFYAYSGLPGAGQQW